MRPQQGTNKTQKESIWLSRKDTQSLADLPLKDLEYEVMPSEEAVGRAMLDAHHINKFKAGGTIVTEADEAECRRAKHIHAQHNSIKTQGCGCEFIQTSAR